MNPWPFARSEVHSVPARARQLPLSVAPEVVDLDLMIDRLAGDESLAGEVIAVFLTDCARRLQAVRIAIENQNGDQLRIAAHALVGLAGNVAAGRLIEAGRSLERIATDGSIADALPAWGRVVAEASLVVQLLQQLRSSADWRCADARTHR